MTLTLIKYGVGSTIADNLPHFLIHCLDFISIHNNPDVYTLRRLLIPLIHSSHDIIFSFASRVCHQILGLRHIRRALRTDNACQHERRSRVSWFYRSSVSAWIEHGRQEVPITQSSPFTERLVGHQQEYQQQDRQLEHLEKNKCPVLNADLF